MSNKFNNEEINILVGLIKDGDEKAAVRFYNIFNIYIEGIVRKYSKRTNIKDDDDLRSYIRIGFYKAALNFKEDKNTQFKNYAYFWIKKVIFSEEQQFRIIKLPINQKLFYDDIVNKMKKSNGTIDTDISDDDIKQLEFINRTNVNLFSTYKQRSVSDRYDNDNESLNDLVLVCENSAEKERNTVVADIESEKLRYNINVMLSNFSAQDKNIIEHTFGLNGKLLMNTDSLAEELNISSSTLLSKKNKLIRMMRHKSLTEYLFK